MSRAGLAAAVLGLTAVALATAVGAQKSASSNDLFFDRVDVNVVNVEVHVTDHEGRPVTGLTRDDFELRVDGEPVELSNFYAIEDGEPAAADGESAASGAQVSVTAGAAEPRESVPTPARLAPPPEERRLHLVVYVDQLDISPSSRNRVLEGLEVFLEQRLTRGDPVMVVTSHPGFEIVQPFTTDRQRVLDAVRDVRERSASSLLMDRRVILNQLSGATDTSDPVTLDVLRRSTLVSVRQYAQSASQQIGFELDKLRSLVGSLAGLPGRKAVLHLSDGIPERPGEGLFAMWESVFLPSGEGIGFGYRGRVLETASYDLGPRVEELVEEANAQRVSFFTLEAGGNQFAAVGASARGLTSTGERIGGPEIESIEQANSQISLLQLAGGTGGVPFLNLNRPWVRLESEAPSFDSYYSLGFVPTDDKAGTYHRIEVKVRRPGVQVRHREGYKRETTGERIENATVAALLLGRWRNPLRAYLQVGEPQPHKKKTFRVPVQILVPLDRVTLLPGPGASRGLLKVRVAYQGARGVGFGVGDELKVPIEIPDDRLEKAREQHITVSVTLELDPGLHRLAVGVWDEVAAEASFLPYDVYVDGNVSKVRGPRADPPSIIRVRTTDDDPRP